MLLEHACSDESVTNHPFDQVMASDDHRFLSSSLYSSGALVAWDPAPFSADLTQVTFASKSLEKNLEVQPQLVPLMPPGG